MFSLNFDILNSKFNKMYTSCYFMKESTNRYDDMYGKLLKKRRLNQSVGQDTTYNTKGISSQVHMANVYSHH